VQKVLIIEDNASIRKLIRLSLQSNNSRCECEVFEAECGRDGLNLALELMPKVIILDVNLPKINGLEICELLRQESGFSEDEVTILMLSANTQEIDKERGMESGATDYLSKPFSPSYLMNLLKEYSALKIA
jgi:DNA-binding response OmpR family regulator